MSKWEGKHEHDEEWNKRYKGLSRTREKNYLTDTRSMNMKNKAIETTQNEKEEKFNGESVLSKYTKWSNTCIPESRKKKEKKETMDTQQFTMRNILVKPL